MTGKKAAARILRVTDWIASAGIVCGLYLLAAWLMDVGNLPSLTIAAILDVITENVYACLAKPALCLWLLFSAASLTWFVFRMAWNLKRRQHPDCGPK
jgi:hypothetical protein